MRHDEKVRLTDVSRDGSSPVSLPRRFMRIDQLRSVTTYPPGMSDLGVAPAPHDPIPPTSEPSAPLWLVAVAVALIVALIGVVFVVLTHDEAAKSTRSYPDQWDSRIAPYARIAEKQRGLTFVHPVTVRFLPAAEFEKGVTSDRKELDGEDRTEIEQFTGLMRAFGLITGDIDLFAAVNDFSGGAILAYYSFDDERITVRGEKMTPQCAPHWFTSSPTSSRTNNSGSATG